MKSVFGHVLSDKLYESTHTSKYSASQLWCISSVSDSDLSKFWDLETVGIKCKEFVESYSDTRVLIEFESSVPFVNGRY